MKKSVFEDIKNILEIEYINKIHNILNDINNSIIENDRILKEANKQDFEKYRKKIKIKVLLNIIEDYRVIKLPSENNYDKEKVFIYSGDPYLTFGICMQAIINKCRIKLLYNQFMTSFNNAIIKIIDDILVKYNMRDLIFSDCNYSLEDVKKIENEIIVVGDSTTFELLKYKPNVTFFAYNNIILFSDSETLENLKEAIFIYANENKYELEILYDESLKNAIKYVNSNEYCDTAVLLTEDEKTKSEFIEAVDKKNVYINENPFKKEYGIIYDYLN